VKAGVRSAAVAAAAAGLVFFGALLWWVHLFGAPAYFALAAGEAMMFALGAVAAAVVVHRLGKAWLPAVFPAAMVAAEYLRGRFPLGGFTWGDLGYSQHSNLISLRLAAYTGVWGISMLIFFVNAAAGEGMVRLRRGRRGWRAAALWLAAGLAAAAAPAPLPSGGSAAQAAGRTASLAIVQGNAPGDIENPHYDDVAVMQSHIHLSESLAGPKPDLIIWPESSLDTDPLTDPSFGRPVTDAIRIAGTHFLIGANLDAGPGRFRNSSLYFDRYGNLQGVYDKVHLVPFGEYVPARRFFEPLIKQLRRVPNDGVSGRGPVVFDLPEGKFAPVICFESTFPELIRKSVRAGARLLVVSTNNSSFGRTSASRQHLAFSQLRAAENHMWVAHAALTGISAVVAPDGRVVSSTKMFEPAVLRPKVGFAAGPTFYARTGDWVPAASIALIAALLAVGKRKKHD
jgi:apolipoprotein N-acyltransferase